jgi:hypothetical protein
MTTHTSQPINIISQGLVPSYVENRIRFSTSTNSLTARTMLGWPSFGRLPDEFRHQLIEDTKADDFYVVKSYDTPIAWFARGVWFMPAVKYSVTTSKHANYVRRGMK